MKLLKLWAGVAVVGLAACSDSSQNSPLGPSEAEPLSSRSGSVRVTNPNDAGPGSFRAAVAAANADASIRRIEFAHGLQAIAVQQAVVYSGTQTMKIEGNGSVIDGAGLDPAAAAAFLADGGGDLTLTKLSVRNAPQEGVTVQIPSGSTGTRSIVLQDMTALANRG